MQLKNDDQARTRLAFAQRLSDVQAKQDVALYVFEKWHWRVKRLFCSDPAIDRSDLEQVFFQGIFEAVDDAALDKGDPLYFLSQRGVWRVTSMLSSTRLLRRGSESATARDAIDAVTADHEEGPAEIVIRRESARQVAVALADELDGTARIAFDSLFRAAATHDESLYRRCAEQMGVSPQRVSQLMQGVRQKAHTIDASAFFAATELEDD